MVSASRIQNFPVSFFAMVMGLAGLTIAWEKAQVTMGLGVNLSGALAPFTAGLFVALLTVYSLKVFNYRDAVIMELHHPIKLSFFPTISISLILLSVAFLHMAPGLAHGVWLFGSVLHLLFTLYVMNSWIHHDHFEIHHINPSWFIPVVGNLLVPVAGTSFGYIELSWFFFSIGILFWIILLTIIFYRVLFHHPLPTKLMPTFFILIAPPAVGFISYVKLTGDVDAFARILYYSGLFLTLLMSTQIRRFINIKFFISWWAYSFPLAAITIATLLMYESTGLAFFSVLSWVLLSILSAIILFLLYRTAKAVGGKQVCLPEE